MALWKDAPPTPATKEPGATPAAREPLIRESDRPAAAAIAQEVPRRTSARSDVKESLIAADLTIEGKIEGSGHIRLAGNFKGDVNVQGNLTIEPGARLTGQVHANTVNVGGELQGNIVAAARVELLDGGVIVGDVKAGSLTVAAGSRMRGQVEFGWEEKGAKSGGNGKGSGTNA